MSSFISSSAAQPRREVLVSSGQASDDIPVVAFINSIPGEPYLLSSPLVIVSEKVSDGYVSSFEAANIHGSGETLRAAVRDVISLVLDMYDMLSKNEDRLGKAAARQLQVLRSHISTSIDAHKRSR